MSAPTDPDDAPSLAERMALARFYGDSPDLSDAEDPRWWLLGLALFALDCLRHPLVRNHVLQTLSANLRMLGWSLATCGIGYFVWWRSWNRWHLDARRAAKAGRRVQPW